MSKRSVKDALASLGVKTEGYDKELVQAEIYEKIKQEATMAITGTPDHRPFLHRQLIDMLEFKLPPKDIMRLKSGEYQIQKRQDHLTLDTHLAVMDGNKTVYSMAVSDDLFNQFTSEESMSNKFLPFVVESSTPVHIFKTLLTRSKGMNRVTLASIFNLTLHEDVNKLRKYAKELPEMQLEAMYEEMLTKWPKYRIDGAILRRFEYIPDHLNIVEHVNEKLSNEFSHLDIMMFLYCLSGNTEQMAEYTEIKWWRIIDLTDVYTNLNGYILLSDAAETRVNVRSEDELDGFIAYASTIEPQILGSEDPMPAYNITYKEAGVPE
jgi:hypothetical protein